MLQVNDINFENMSNDDAVRVLREIVHKPGSDIAASASTALMKKIHPRGCFTVVLILCGRCPRWKQDSVGPHINKLFVTFLCRVVTLTVAKCWDPNPRDCFMLPRSKSQ